MTVIRKACTTVSIPSMVTGVPQGDGADAEGGAEKEDETDHFSPVAENGEEPVMDMIGAHIIDPVLEALHLAGDDPLDGDIGHVVDQDPEDEDGGGEGNDGIVVRPGGLDGQGRKDKTEERASRVAQEDRCLSCAG